MNYRYATIHAAEALSAAATKTIDINVTDPISRIDVRWHITKSKHAMDAHGAGDITKIELVDGSDVLHSLTGYENQALCLYDRRVETMAHGQHLSACSECNIFGIDFGRRLWDPELAFVPTMFKNPQLKVTFVLTTSDSGASAAEIEVMAHCFDEKTISPIGFLMAKELYSYTCGAENSYEHIDLPTDHPIRKMLIRGYHDGHEAWDAVKEMRLDEDNQKRIPFDVNGENYYRIMKGVWVPIQEQVVSVTDAGGSIVYVTPTDYYAIMAGIGVNSGAVISVGTWQPGGKFTVVGSTSMFYMAMVRGYMPHACWEFPFGDQQDIDDWYDVTKCGSVRLRNKAGSSGASATSQVALQQIRRY